jgi:hypothetical protein
MRIEEAEGFFAPSGEGDGFDRGDFVGESLQIAL